MKVGACPMRKQTLVIIGKIADTIHGLLYSNDGRALCREVTCSTSFGHTRFAPTSLPDTKTSLWATKHSQSSLQIKDAKHLGISSYCLQTLPPADRATLWTAPPKHLVAIATFGAVSAYEG